MTSDDDIRALVKRLQGPFNACMHRSDCLAAIERLRAERDHFEEAGNAMALAYSLTAQALARSGDECAALRKKAHRVMDADLCLDAVTEARRVLREYFGANHAFLDDDLIRGVVKMREQIVALEQERDALQLRVQEQSLELLELDGRREREEKDRHAAEQKFDALVRALKTHAGDHNGWEFGLGCVKHDRSGKVAEFLWAMQEQIDAAIDAAMKGASDE